MIPEAEASGKFPSYCLERKLALILLRLRQRRYVG